MPFAMAVLRHEIREVNERESLCLSLETSLSGGNKVERNPLAGEGIKRKKGCNFVSRKALYPASKIRRNRGEKMLSMTTKIYIFI